MVRSPAWCAFVMLVVVGCAAIDVPAWAVLLGALVLVVRLPR